MEKVELKTESETMQGLLKTLAVDYELLECLVRKELSLELTIKRDVQYLTENKTVDEYELNEKRILLIETKSRIETLRSVIKEKQTHFKKYSEKFDKDLTEMRAKYDVVLQKAKEVQHKNKQANWLLTNANKELLDSSVEQKVFFYLKLKEAVK